MVCWSTTHGVPSHSSPPQNRDLALKEEIGILTAIVGEPTSGLEPLTCSLRVSCSYWPSLWSGWEGAALAEAISLSDNQNSLMNYRPFPRLGT